VNLLQKPPDSKPKCRPNRSLTRRSSSLLHFFTYRMRVLHEILNDLTDYPKYDYRGIRGNRTGRTLGPDSDLLCPLQAKFTVAVSRTGGDTEVFAFPSRSQCYLWFGRMG